MQIPAHLTELSCYQKNGGEMCDYEKEIIGNAYDNDHDSYKASSKYAGRYWWHYRFFWEFLRNVILVLCVHIVFTINNESLEIPCL